MSAARVRAGGRRPLVAERGCLVVADISGYTGYIVESPLEDAEDVVADVTATIAERLGPVLRVNKLEGDAVFGYALEDETDGSMLLDAVEQCYFGFRRRLESMQHATSCGCKACTKLPDLDLKFVLHHGEFIRRAGAAGEELTGHDVILVHRLLKNGVAEVVGTRGYALMTEACVEGLGLDPDALGMREHRETYDDVGGVRAFVLDLEARYTEENERRRVVVASGEAAFELDALVEATPPIVWEYLTAPDKRVTWQGTVEEASIGGRRRTGTTSVCIDGRALVYEEILDWRPFDYFTETRTLPRSAKVVLTTTLEPVDAGTRVRIRGDKPNGTGGLLWLATRRNVVRRLRTELSRLAAAVSDERT
jgi:Protein of unknown function (DUF2652)/Polyketide cyclase / dehydrase and lipid transport